MLNISRMIASAEECLGWPYVSPGTNDANGIDCSGLFVKMYRDQGASIYHGSNTIYRKYCGEKGELKSVSQLAVGMAVFKWNDRTPSKFDDGLGDFQHIGFVASVNPLRIIHASSASGCVVTDTKIGKWKYWGKLKDVDYGGGGSAKKEVTIVVEYATVTGGALNMRAEKSRGAEKITSIPDGSTVAVLEHDDEWCNVTYNSFSGYVMTKYLSFGASDGTAGKTSKIAISLPEDCANTLYEALRNALKK